LAVGKPGHRRRVVIVVNDLSRDPSVCKIWRRIVDSQAGYAILDLDKLSDHEI
jgi:hypothetical protein